METMTLDDLMRILVECAGSEEGVLSGEDVFDRSFEDLGYDSLALMESAARIKQEFGVSVPDDDITEVETPRSLLDLVNGAITATATAAATVA
ncbi:act minimal PKS acyl carrier protein [Streptomyces sp. DvalAA-14]|uniref:acyl carrier protein n=1 Tax=unclassified Streptomyces TaxID=2593676 RepID=UPI00081B4DB7|nr:MULTISPECIES: acyl carrier protein [unclassified Streptomyces]MYS20705.1 actinorhodin polyketide synthase [Streptomyces sp. SID4948]SCD75183.1 act minimal PKS acyl carrier protein [Streptomyces sp. DvalAA-14]